VECTLEPKLGIGEFNSWDCGTAGKVSTNVAPQLACYSIETLMDSSSQFEWRAHFRQNGWGIYGLYLLTIVIGVWHWAGFIGIGLVTISLAGCFNYCESLLILKLDHQSARDFLKTKILSQFSFFMKFIAPLVLWYLFRFPEHWLAYLILLLFIVSILPYLFLNTNHISPTNRLHRGKFMLE
jgi:hypothetical protein